MIKSWIGQLNSEYRKLRIENLDKGNNIILGALSKLQKLNKERKLKKVV